MKKLFSAMLTLALTLGLLTLFPTRVSADTYDLTAQADTVRVSPGGTAVMTVRLTENPGFAYLRLSMDYDADVLTLKSVSDSGLFDSGMDFVGGKPLTQKPYRMIWSSPFNRYSEGELIRLTFAVSSKAKGGRYPVSFKMMECYDSDCDDVSKNASFRGYLDVRSRTEGVSGIVMNKLPSKTAYEVGQNLESAGLALVATYTDGTKAKITDGYTCSPTALTKAGQQKITVKFGGKTTTFDVTVKEVKLDSVSLGQKPDKTVYYVNETFTSEGMTVLANYDNGKSVDVTGDCVCTPAGRLTTVGEQPITVSYGGKTTVFCVTVKNPPKAIGMKITRLPNQTLYAVGQTFSAAGMKLNVAYDDGTIKQVTSGYTCFPSGKMTKTGKQTITVSCQGRTATFDVTVEPAARAVTEVHVAQYPSKMVYQAGELFRDSGMKLKITREDGSTEYVTSGWAAEPDGKLSAGRQKITVRYGGKAAGFYVTVKPAGVRVTALTVVRKPAKLTYAVDDSFSPVGLKLKATYSDGSTEELTSGYTYTPDGKLTEAGQQKITVRYGGKAQGFYVTVKAPRTVAKLSVSVKPTKVTYALNDTFRPAGMKLTVTYSDGDTEELTSGYTYTPTGKLTEAGKQKITVRYGGKAAGFYVTVVDKTVRTLEVTRSYSYAYEVLRLVNEERARVGSKPLTMDASLLETAMVRSGEIVLKFSHTRPNGESCFSLFQDDSNVNGENIAAGYLTPADVVQGWMDSPGHKANILNDDFKTIGIGCIRHDSLYQIYWTQCFGDILTSDASRNTYQDGARTQTIKVDPSLIDG